MHECGAKKSIRGRRWRHTSESQYPVASGQLKIAVGLIVSSRREDLGRARLEPCRKARQRWRALATEVRFESQAAEMTPAGYMAKRVGKRPDWLRAPHVVDVYSVTNCTCEDFADYIQYWKHNGYWLFDSPEIIKSAAGENSIQLEGTSLFYYEVHEMEFDGQAGRPFFPEASFPTKVVQPSRKQLEGFDVVTFYVKTNPECSPLSCNSMAEELHTNAHCLFASFEDAETAVSRGAFNESGPGPYRIFAVYSVDWP